jgi:hypothetical protein
MNWMKAMKRKSQKNKNVQMKRALTKVLAETEGRDWLTVQAY